jgi:hypothetical protein
MILGQQAIADQAVVRVSEAQVHEKSPSVLAALDEQLPHLRRREVAPAVFVEHAGGEEEVARLTEPPAMRDLAREALERAGLQLDLGARVGVAALGLQRQRTAQRVQAEHRVGARQQRQVGQRRARHQVPVDDVAERAR